MNKIISLDKIDINKNANVISIDGNLKDRLYSLGLDEGSLIKCEFESPFKNPRAYLIKGCTIAIRNEDAKNIMVIYND